MVQVDDNWIQKKFKLVLREGKKEHSKKLITDNNAYLQFSVICYL